ncbi:cytochrome P450 family protein [Pleurotus pulmonarius]
MPLSILPAVVFGASSAGCSDLQVGLTPFGNRLSTPNELGLQCCSQSEGNTTYLSCRCNGIGLSNEFCLANVGLTSVSYSMNINWVPTEPVLCLSDYFIPNLRPVSASQSARNTAILAMLTATIYFFLKALFTNRPVDNHGCSIPYGPIGLPILGSFPFLTRYPELTLDYWAKKFGPLYSLWLGNQLFVVVSDPHIAKDLMVTNGAIFSSRKEMFLKSKTIFAGRGITATPYNETWRKHRRIAATFLVQKAVDGYTNILDYEATVLVKELFTHSQGGTVPVNPQPYAGRCSLNNMLTVVFGTRTNSINHPLVGRALRLSREFMNCTGPVSNMTDFIPLLQKIPNYMTLRGKQLHKDLVETYGGMILDIDKRMKSGEKVSDCLVKTMLEAKEKEQLDHIDMSILCAAFMIGGVETTASIMQWFSALIPAYPQIQAKAQAELDRVVGRDRLPNVEDEKNMPYIHAIIKEVERCHNPFWLGTPHVNTQDFTYRGQFIPKNTVVVLNTYTMHHDPIRHPDPHTFNPDRYINDSTSSSESANLVNAYERDHWMFGAGRRICPGMWVAEREIWLAISRMLWAFEMKEIPGAPIDLKEYDGLSGRSPVPFRIRVVPRHAKVKEVLGL